MSNKPSKQILLNYLENKVTYTRIAKLHGVKQASSVKKWYKSYGIELPRRQIYNGHNDRLISNKKCLNCDNNVNKINQYRTKYCSPKCQAGYQYKDYIDRWKKGYVNGLQGKVGISNHIRRYLFEKYEGKCCKCSWNIINIYTNNIPLQIHHKDGNCFNNNEENLELLCPNCHSLTHNFGSRNGKLNKGRRKILSELKLIKIH